LPIHGSTSSSGNSRSSADAEAAAAALTAPAALQHGRVGRHLANRNGLSVSGSVSYALLLLYVMTQGDQVYPT